MIEKQIVPTYPTFEKKMDENWLSYEQNSIQLNRYPPLLWIQHTVEQGIVIKRQILPTYANLVKMDENWLIYEQNSKKFKGYLTGKLP